MSDWTATDELYSRTLTRTEGRLLADALHHYIVSQRMPADDHPFSDLVTDLYFMGDARSVDDRLHEIYKRASYFRGIFLDYRRPQALSRYVIFSLEHFLKECEHYGHH